MINFRYHVVSLTSVFLALAIGVVLGTAALNGPIVDNLRDQLSGLRKSNGQYRDRVAELEDAADSRGKFMRELATSTLANTMTNRSVVIVEGPGAQAKDREGVVGMLQTGGAKLTGSVRINRDFIDPKRDETLHDLASQRVLPGVDLPNSGVGVQTATALLASVLLNGAPVSNEDRTTVLQAFTDAGFITVEGKIDGQADAAVIVLGPPATERNAGQRDDATVMIVREFDRVGKYVTAAAPLAGGNGDPLVEIRDDEALRATVSTVDGVSTADGQLVTAMAAVEQFNGKAGHYGSGEGAQARVPQIR